MKRQWTVSRNADGIGYHLWNTFDYYEEGYFLEKSDAKREASKRNRRDMLEPHRDEGAENE
jgi:hypothetical protein